MKTQAHISSLRQCYYAFASTGTIGVRSSWKILSIEATNDNEIAIGTMKKAESRKILPRSIDDKHMLSVRNI
ncbi:hypothetical protein D1B31_15240 [Neobacillus notoginsengisoli]|uniref:Uncharacterized protein n=1 Tax=Neobacillus notoginsengisoli TaxID=1578198 RepID=A0A417YS72_9BACI|nr:hypothetical protein [Neobacillus notoginsengisoli]RHW38129.1 hypothetical protein D1B31_15240 [Neobacillus notoginsengisoli]